MEKDTKELTKEDLLNPDFIPSIFENYKDPQEREEVLTEIMEIGKTYKVGGKLKDAIGRCTQAEQSIAGQVFNFLIFNKSGNPEVTTQNFLNIFENDPKISNNVRYDEFSGIVSRFKNGKWVPWTDSDDSDLMCDIEKEYKIYNSDKYYKAFDKFIKDRAENPLKELIEREPWDGVPRLDRFLIDIFHCDDERYTEEVSRMIFYGGISRLYDPGCKFDYMPIFIGAQGTYKSTLVKWLALEEKYFREISTIEGKDAMEILEGAWICEFAELLAMVRTREVEAMKGYISRTTDTFRRSYDRRVSHVPRSCIFIGTTNEEEFLVDKTGNRRYLPIKIRTKMGEFYGKEEEIKNYILSCWREALYLYNHGQTYLSLPLDVYEIAVRKQEGAVEDDPKVGLIREYLDNQEVGYKVCCLELFTKCLNGIKKNYDRSASRDIGRILNNIPGWERGEKPARLQDYGVQKYWEKME
jgi:predicted P-loop ATPase